MGIYPTSFTEIMAPAVDRLIGGYHTALAAGGAPHRGEPRAGGDSMNWTLACRAHRVLLAVGGMALLMLGVFLKRGPRCG